MSPPPKTTETKEKKHILAKFKRYKTKNKLSAEDAAEITGYSLRTLQSWMVKLGQRNLPKRKTPVRKALLDDISQRIRRFIQDEFGSMRGAGYRPIEIDVVVKKAEELSEKFNSLTPANKKQQIYRSLKKFQSDCLYFHVHVHIPSH